MSYVKRGVSTQGGADTFVSTAIDTNITADGKAGWEIKSFSAYWSNGEAVAAADFELNALITTQATVTTFDQDEEIYRLNWACQNTAGVAVAMPQSLVKREFFIQERLTVQPIVYVHVSSVATAATNVVYWEFTYDIVKLTDLEVLRLLQGGV